MSRPSLKREGFGIAWPFSDAFLLALVALYLLASVTMITWLKRAGRHPRGANAIMKELEVRS